LYEANLKKLPSFERQKVKNIISDNCSNLSYGILSRKMIHKEAVEKAFKGTR
jgi:hypothetical protein